MRIAHLEYLIDLARSKSINHTAKNFFMSQQGLSQTLKRLEEDLGVALFNRSKTGVSLTEQGKIVVQYGQDILALYHEMSEKIQQLNPPSKCNRRQTLVITSSSMVSGIILPTIVDEFHGQYPDIRIQFKELAITEAIANVKKGTSNIAVFSLPTGEVPSELQWDVNLLLHQPRLHLERLLSYHIIACVSQNSPLLAKSFLSQEDLSRLPLILYHPLYETPAITEFYNNDNVVCISNNMDIHARLITQGAGISLMPDFTFNLIFASESVAAIPLDGAINSAVLYSITSAEDPGDFVSDFLTTIKGRLGRVDEWPVQV